MRVVGNKDVWKDLLRARPPVALLRGPEGCGRRQTAKLMASGPLKSMVSFIDGVTVSCTMEIQRLASVKSSLRIVVIDPKNHSAEGWSDLLALLENPPASLKVWIIDRNTTPAAIVGRSMQFWFDSLSCDEIVSELEQRRALSIEEKDVLTDAKPSSLSEAQELLNAIHKRSVVGLFFKAVRERNREELLYCVDGWDDRATFLLRCELEAQAQGHSVIFTAPFPELKDEDLLYTTRLLSTLSPSSGAVLLAGLRII